MACRQQFLYTFPYTIRLVTECVFDHAHTYTHTHTLTHSLTHTHSQTWLGQVLVVLGVPHPLPQVSSDPAPHQLAQRALHALLAHQEDQTVVLYGCKSAGKTRAARDTLAAMLGMVTGVEGMKEKVMAASLALEALGGHSSFIVTSLFIDPEQIQLTGCQFSTLLTHVEEPPDVAETVGSGLGLPPALEQCLRDVMSALKMVIGENVAKLLGVSGEQLTQCLASQPDGQKHLLQVIYPYMLRWIG